MHHLDVSGINERKKGRLQRRVYNVQGVNHLWHVDTISSQIGPKSNRLQSNRPQVKSAPVKSAPSQIGSSQIGPNSNRPQVKSAPSQIGLKMKVIPAQKNKNKKRINK